MKQPTPGWMGDVEATCVPWPSSQALELEIETTRHPSARTRPARRGAPCPPLIPQRPHTLMHFVGVRGRGIQLLLLRLLGGRLTEVRWERPERAGVAGEKALAAPASARQMVAFESIGNDGLIYGR